MAHTTRTASIVMTLVATGATALGASVVLADAPDAAPQPSTVFDAATLTPVAPVALEADNAPDAGPLTEQQQQLVDWAEDRFAQAGLELPELTVRFDPTRELCDHNDGRYQHAADGQRIVTICTRDGDSFAADLERRRTLLHEFGHAWDFANLSDEDRAELGHALGVDHWNDHDAAWEDRGVERFAETFVYALLDQPRRQLKVDLDCTDLIGSFRTATGAEPLGPGVPHCAA